MIRALDHKATQPKGKNMDKKVLNAIALTASKLGKAIGGHAGYEVAKRYVDQQPVRLGVLDRLYCIRRIGERMGVKN